MSLKIEIRKDREGRYVAALDGRLDTQTYQQCEDQIAPLIVQAITLILDLEKLTYISSMGLRVLLKARKSLESHRGRLLLTHLQPQIARIIEIANALPKEQIFASIAEADRYFDAMQRQALDEQRDSAANRKPSAGSGL
ncbi:MAG TPA: STAS domain-containing protein [Candidatus Paceibacterota bacterium]|nr:STAS domain-containing protein [Verrucomicrobiota bacterium]HRY48936.1 STAS domain-containing protein [Candidatus Paceibacterota bacterium]HSA01790.1 STAS domain-containing protein [Candidatus Paceibacterota bacterium]